MTAKYTCNRLSLFMLSFLLCVLLITAGPVQSTSLLISPASVKAGEKFRILLVSEFSLRKAALNVLGAEGLLSAENIRQGGEDPFWLSAEFKPVSFGEYKIIYIVNDASSEEVKFSVEQTRIKRVATDFIWQTERAWDQKCEDLFSVWIQLLFPVENTGEYWSHLHDITRDQQRNFLFDHLSLGEDLPYSEGGLRMVPDCADNPFFLRAYFAWKLGLPYGNFKCDRGREDRAPLCQQWFSNHSRREAGAGDIKAFQYFLIAIMDSIHSGSARTALNADATDLYPVPLTRAALKPGTVFADPYGHTLTLVGWIPQQDNNPGLLMAVDAQPDGSIGLKRFWQGSFFFNTIDVIGEPGFKRFRPIEWEGEHLRLFSNQEIINSKDYGNFSIQQGGLDPQLFYDRMERIISPDPLPPEKIYRDLHEAIQEQLEARVQAVKRGEEYMRSNGYKKILMPSGAGIFQTIGPWEDFSTPSRDLRLLISLDVLLDFPNRIQRNPEAFVIASNKTPEQIQQELLTLHAEWCREFNVSYTGSDGAVHKLTLAEVILRQEAMEMAYNPNDCIEIRWGTPADSMEFRSCQRQAPAEQRKKMEQYRKWFRSRTFPRR